MFAVLKSEMLNSLMHPGVCWIRLLCDNSREAKTKELHPGKALAIIVVAASNENFFIRTWILLPLLHPEQSL